MVPTRTVHEKLDVSVVIGTVMVSRGLGQGMEASILIDRRGAAQAPEAAHWAPPQDACTDRAQMGGCVGTLCGFAKRFPLNGIPILPISRDQI